MTRLSYEIVDVFTDGGAFTGNPLAVVLDADDLTTEQMQALAREFNLSETAFPLPSTAGDYRLRIFTPGAELAFAGHPSVGSAWLLKELGRLPEGRLVQECGAGLLGVGVHDHGALIRGGTPTMGEPQDPAPWLDGLGLTGADLVGEVRSAGTGTEFTFVTVASAEAVDRCEPGRLPSQVFVVWHDGAEQAYARMFAPDLGVAEDPATGSAVLGWGVLLRAAGHEGVVHVRQGVRMGRPSLLHLRIEADSLAVGGACARVASGTVVAP